jgi:membrane protein DedA with SNARE-associated domain
MGAALEFFHGLHPWAVYVVLGLGAAIENVLPPIPADTFVVLGGFLATQGRAAVVGVFLATWLANAGGALLVYEVGRRRGEAFFRSGSGRHLLSAGQLETVDRFYQRWGVAALVFTRFLPGLRAVVPVFAGVSKEPLRRVAPPILVASAIWYGALVWAGASAQGNIDEIEAWLSQANRGFLTVALVVIGALVVWWHRSRRRT